MNRIYHKFLIVFSIFILIGGAYLYFSNGLTSEASLSSSLGSSLKAEGEGEGEVASDLAFISTLASLTRINIDTTIFTSKAFKSLNDNTVKIEMGSSGRVNPFAPIGKDANLNTSSSQVTTNNPLEIKNTTAVLSGVVSNTVGVSNAYFEYGLTEELGITSPFAAVSLIGIFITNITDLELGANYFYKACAKINGATFCGEIVSFSTQ